MVIMGMDMALKNRLIATATLLAFHSPIITANEWRFDPTIRVNETYTDNVNLDLSDEESSFVNQLGLGANILYNSSKTMLTLEGELIRASYNHNSDLDDTYLTLDGNIKVDLWSSGLSFIGLASIQNKPENSYDNPYADLISGSTTQYEQYSTGFEYSVKNNKYTIDSSLLYNITKSEDGLGEQDGYSANFNSKNGTSAAPLFWEVDASYSERNNNNTTGRSQTGEVKVGYITPYKINPFVRLYQEDNSGNASTGGVTESDSYGFGFRWLVIPRLTVDLSYNFPTDQSSDDGSSDSQDDYFDINIDWQPTVRTTLKAGLSQRFYGDSYDFSLSHKIKRLTNTISYNETIEIFTRDNFVAINQGSFWCPNSVDIATFDVCVSNTSGLNLDEFSLRPIIDYRILEDNSFSLNKRWSWLTSLALSRTTFTFTASKSERISLLDSNADIDSPDNTKNETESVNFTISRKISGYSTVDLSSNYTKTNNSIGLDTERLNRHRMYKVDYNKDLNSTLTLTVGLSRQSRDSVFSLFTYTENRISLELNKVL